jgi:hypothetical protein
MGFMNNLSAANTDTSPMLARIGLSLSKKMTDKFYKEQWETSE